MQRMSPEAEGAPEHLEPDEIADEFEPLPTDDPNYISESDGEDNGNNELEFKDDSVQGFFAHKEPVYSVDLHPTDDTLVLTGGGDDKAYLWRRDTGEAVHPGNALDGFTDSVTAVGFNVDGSLMAAAGLDGQVRVWATATGQLTAALEGPSADVNWIEWHGKGNILLAGSADGTMWMWLLPSGQFMQVFSGHAESVTCGKFTPDGKTIVSGADNGSLIIWDPKTASAIHRLSGADDARFHSETITCVGITADSTLAMTGSSDHTARLVHIQNGNIVGSLGGHTESIETVGFSPVLPFAATGSVDCTVNIWDTQTLRLRQTVRHDGPVTKLQWHATSPLMTTSSGDGTVRVWDARTGQCEQKWVGHEDVILDFAQTRDGRTVVTGSDDGCSLVFNY
ncbi:WD40-repeat-containing domain protein [Dimargaris cristalligena]|uniref:WD40-repeat-containing domain protein n=1 Tax=Dimargaris cristalligena TaxID=215637 RepID=A0A4P9ZYF2_9FUNG|nr:WD40-repeat-containing domain protein [Dimargaris cristalligena]|eukprot:RKP38736.1 WD40-repeat-containing domain protein [Dimargaris cristalligena]